MPADSNKENVSRDVTSGVYSLVSPTPVRDPSLVGWSQTLANQFSLNRPDESDRADLDILSGNSVLAEMQSYAACYGGHQFGSWAGQLGDGRAIGLGELLDNNCKSWEVQLKGAGPTPFSRRADGRAVLRSSIREFLASEAMFHLGVPTSRALCVVATGELVPRDMFYDGNQRLEPGAIVTRLAPTFLRFGSFEIWAARGNSQITSQLADWTIENFFSHLSLTDPDCHEQWFKEICDRSIATAIEWLRVGFVHGVLNTDNMSILGLTIDYGPYGWLEVFDQLWTPNTTDLPGKRYCYGRQPGVVIWNLHCLAIALQSLVPLDRLLKVLEAAKNTFGNQYLSMIGRKLGLVQIDQAHDSLLIEELFRVLELIETDMTIFFRQLGSFAVDHSTTEGILLLMDAYYEPLPDSYREALAAWLVKYQARLKAQGIGDLERKTVMNMTNPKYVLRNYMAHQAIELAEQGDNSKLFELLSVLEQPYEEQPGLEQWALKRPEWARTKAGCSMLSCSS